MKKIKIPKNFQNQIKEMIKEYSVIFVTAPAGIGKTTVVQEYLKNKKIAYSYISSLQEDFQESLQNVKQKLIVIDDFQDILPENEEILKANFKDILRKHQIFILSRAYMPSWLKLYQLLEQVGCLRAENFYLTDQEVKEYLEANQIHMEEQEIQDISQKTQKYPMSLKFVCFHVQAGERDIDIIAEKVAKDIFDYFDEMVVKNWRRESYIFLLQVGWLESFTLELASMITGNQSIQDMIEEVNRAGAILEPGKQGYVVEPFFRRYLSYKQKKELSETAINNIYYNTGLYYELHYDMKNALKYYSMCKNEEKIRDVLVRNSNLHPGISHYLEVEEYYRAFPEEKILENPDLMCGMCMLCSLNIQVEESEKWYKALQAYGERFKKNDLNYKYVKSKLYWLDISLPHRGSADLESLILNLVPKKKNKELNIQDVSVTSNQPSGINGGKDFSQWVLKADMLYPLMKPAASFVLGKTGEGLVDICFAEKMFEQADPNTYQIMNYVNSGIYDASTRGKLETVFAGTMLQHRLYLSQGNREAAYQLMQDLKKRVEEEKQTQILPNLNAVMVLYNLRIGKKEVASTWMREEAPNENKRFNVFERYRYLVKARCYIAEQRYMEGVALLNRMIQYGIEYDRTIIRIQARTLLAIILYRMKDESWKEVLEEALLEAQKYHYIRMIAEEGTAILPLLQKLQAGLDKDYEKKLLQNVKREAVINPSYLKLDNVKLETLTATEKSVLELIGDGMKNKEIAEFLNISLNTVAYHTKNIYQKLEINNRSQAIKIAKEMGKPYRRIAGDI